jgi:hypothetical protein
MKLSFCGLPLEPGLVFIDADTGDSDEENRQATEPVRLLGGPEPLETSRRNQLIDRFYNTEFDAKTDMLREVGMTDDEINTLMRNSQNGYSRDNKQIWKAYEARFNANRKAEWSADDKAQPHFGLWGYRTRMVKVEDWESATREEVIVRVKHFVLSNEAEVARLKTEVERFEKFERNPATPREPIPEDVQSFVWRRDGGRCVKCGSQEKLEFDHIIPLARGGSNTERNIQLLCEYHNRSKGAGELLFADAAPAVVADTTSKDAFLVAIRSGKPALYNMVIAQAQKIEIGGDRVTFTFSTSQRALRDNFEKNREWLESTAHQVWGRQVTVSAVQV